jgi:hypothetical protein
VLLTAVPFLRRMTWRLPDTYHSAGTRRGTATLKFYEGRDILRGEVAPESRISTADARARSSDCGYLIGPLKGLLLLAR